MLVADAGFWKQSGGAQIGRLEVHPWADDRSAKEQRRLGAILRSNWREQFEQFVRRVGAAEVYVTIDLDCLREEEAIDQLGKRPFSSRKMCVWALDMLAQG